MRATGLVAGPSEGSAVLPVRPRLSLARLGELLQGEDARRGVAAVLDQGIVSGLSFATSSIIAAATGSFGLGVAHLALTLVVFLMNVQGELVTAPYTVYRSRREGGQLAVYSGSALLHQATLTLLGALALLGFLLVLSLGIGPTHLAPALWMVLFTAPFCLLHSFLRHFSFACLRFRDALAIDIAVAALQLPLLLVLLLTGQLTVPRVFAVMGGACAAACLGWFLVRPGSFRFTPRALWGHWRENWTFGRWAISSHVVGCAMTYVLPWLLAGVHSESATGLLAACGKLSALAATFVLGVAHFLTPRAVTAYAERGVAGLHRVLAATGLVLLVSVGAFCGVIAVTGDWLMVTLFGADFAHTGPLVTVLSFSVLLNSVAVLAGNGLWAIDRPQANLIGDVAALLATLLAALALVQPLGALGAALAILVGCALGAVVRVVTFVCVVRCEQGAYRR